MILSFMRYQKYNHLNQIKEGKIIFNWEEQFVFVNFI